MIKKAIGIAGPATAGKDMLATEIMKRFTEFTFQRVSFAEKIRNMLDPILQEFHGISAYTNDKFEKKLIRPYLVGLGEGKRMQVPSYWINQVKKNVDLLQQQGIIPIFTDVRHFEFEDDEMGYIKSIGGFNIYINRIKLDGNLLEPCGDNEYFNDKLLQKNADYVLINKTFKKPEHITDALGEMFSITTNYLHHPNY